MKYILTSILFFVSVSSQAFVAQNKQESTDKSYVAVLEAPMGYQFWYCQQGASDCVTLGPRSVYTKGDLDKLIKKEQWAAIGGSTAAVAAVVAGIWIGFPLGFVALDAALPVGAFASVSTNTMIAVGGGTGVVAVAAVTNVGLSKMFHRLNPIDRVKGSLALRTAQTQKQKTVPNVHEFAIWLDDILSN